MEQLTAKVPKTLERRIEEYRRSQSEIPNQSEVVRDALDEFLPELEGDVQEAEA